jgi:hypothetical protein
MPFCRTLLALIVFASVLPAGELRTLKGESVSGDLVSVDAKELVLTKGTQRIVTPSDDVLHLDLAATVRIPNGTKYIEVELIDGSLLRCSALGIKGKEAELTMLLTGQMIKIPLASIANLLTDAQDPNNRKKWQDRLKERLRKRPPPTRDLLALVKDGVVNGLDGTLGEGTEDGTGLNFTLSSGRKAPVALERIHGLIFLRQHDPHQVTAVFKLIDSYEDLVLVSSVTTTETGLSVTTPAGAKLDYTFAQLAKLDYSKGRLTYLSDMTPTRLNKDDKDKEGIVFFEKDQTTYEGRFVPIRMNRVVYPKGLFIQATTEVEYDLGGDYREFKAIVGIDDYDTRGEDCPTTLVIEGDGKELLTMTVNPKDKERVRPVTLNIKDMQKLKITVRSGGGVSTVARQVTLADAKVSK